MIGKIRQRILFTKPERYLLRHQAKPFVLNRDCKVSSDTSDYDPPREFVNEHSLYLHKILKGVRNTELKKGIEVDKSRNEFDRDHSLQEKSSLVELIPKTNSLLHTQRRTIRRLDRILKIDVKQNGSI